MTLCLEKWELNYKTTSTCSFCCWAIDSRSDSFVGVLEINLEGARLSFRHIFHVNKLSS